MADVEILAEDAAQVATTEEDRSGAIPAAQALFFAEVRKRAGDSCPSADPANSGFVFPAIDLAVPRTKPARTQQLLGDSNSLSELSLLVGLPVSRDEVAPWQDEVTGAMPAPWRAGVSRRTLRSASHDDLSKDYLCVSAGGGVCSHFRLNL